MTGTYAGSEYAGTTYTGNPTPRPGVVVVTTQPKVTTVATNPLLPT